MPETTNRHQPGAQECSNCHEYRSCIGWTVYKSDGAGWSAGGNVRLCRDCLLAGAAELEGMRHVKVLVRLLTEAGQPPPHNQPLEALSAALDTAGLPYPCEAPGTSPRPQQAPQTAAQPSTPDVGSLAYWRSRFEGAGVPYARAHTVTHLERRWELWQQAQQMGIDLPDGDGNQEWQTILANAAAAKEGAAVEAQGASA